MSYLVSLPPRDNSESPLHETPKPDEMHVILQSDMKRKKPAKPYWEMTTAELRQATKEYDKEFGGMKTVPVPPKELAKHRRFMKKLRRTWELAREPGSMNAPRR